MDSNVANRKGYLLGVSDELKVEKYIRHPDSYNLVYKTPYETFANGFAFWELDCPPGFVALGGVVTNGQLYPDYGSAYCVSADYVNYAPSIHIQWGFKIPGGDDTSKQGVKINLTLINFDVFCFFLSLKFCKIFSNRLCSLF